MLRLEPDVQIRGYRRADKVAADETIHERLNLGAVEAYDHRKLGPAVGAYVNAKEGGGFVHAASEWFPASFPHRSRARRFTYAVRADGTSGTARGVCLPRHRLPTTRNVTVKLTASSRATLAGVPLGIPLSGIQRFSALVLTDCSTPRSGSHPSGPPIRRIAPLNQFVHLAGGLSIGLQAPFPRVMDAAKPPDVVGVQQAASLLQGQLVVHHVAEGEPPLLHAHCAERIPRAIPDGKAIPARVVASLARRVAEQGLGLGTALLEW